MPYDDENPSYEEKYGDDSGYDHENETEAQACRRMADMLREVPGGIDEVIDYLYGRANELEA
jgi:hypothetical protein